MREREREREREKERERESHLDLSHGKFGFLSPRKAGCDKVAIPNLQHVLGIYVFP